MVKKLIQKVVKGKNNALPEEILEADLNQDGKMDKDVSDDVKKRNNNSKKKWELFNPEQLDIFFRSHQYWYFTFLFS